jgi:hypothetical protein
MFFFKYKKIKSQLETGNEDYQYLLLELQADQQLAKELIIVMDARVKIQKDFLFQ